MGGGEGCGDDRRLEEAEQSVERGPETSRGMLYLEYLPNYSSNLVSTELSNRIRPENSDR